MLALAALLDQSILKCAVEAVNVMKEATFAAAMRAISTWWPRAIVLLLLVLPLLTRIISTVRFNESRRHKRKEGRKIPVVPYYLPGIFHMIPFLRDTAGLTLDITKRYGWMTPLVLKVAHLRCVVSVNPQHIMAIFKNSRFLSARSVTEHAAKHLLDIPKSVIRFYQADDSGMAAEPRKGSNVLPKNRILYMQTHSAQKWMASPHLELLGARFRKFLCKNTEALEISEEWADYPDLFAFLQSTFVKANIETLMGTKILELSPKLVEDFGTAKSYAPEFFKALPSWLIPKAIKARQRVFDAIKIWHDYALTNGDHTNTGDTEPDWDPVWGSKYCKARQQYMLGMSPLTGPVRAREDWGWMFGLNANTHSTIFWYLLHANKEQGLHDRLMEEINSCLVAGQPDISALGKQPLLQSTYAEVLRLHVSILVSRMVEFQDIKVDDYTMSRGDYIFMPTDSMHFNNEVWTNAGRPIDIPLEKFDPERFLVPSETGPQFSLDGLAGAWIPYGGGDRMCPGRHLAKMEMLITLAYFSSNYEIEMNNQDMTTVQSDLKYAPFGALPPDRAVRFRIRRRTAI